MAAVQNTVSAMLETHPSEPWSDRSALEECIAACFDCEQTCTSCADACLGESQVSELVHCIRVNLDCADVCAATGRVLMRLTEPDRELISAQLRACQQACQACGSECAKHADHHEHCRVCMEACRRCEQACERLAQAA